MKKAQFTKAVCSVSEMASVLELSRARFYQLLDTGILPQPIYDVRTKRPYFDLELQEQCIKVKQTGIGANGQYILFYSPRQRSQKDAKTTARKKVSKHQDLAETLETMGVDVSAKEVESAAANLYPDGIDNIDEGLLVRELFRFLKKNGV